MVSSYVSHPLSVCSLHLALEKKHCKKNKGVLFGSYVSRVNRTTKSSISHLGKMVQK